MGLMSNVPKIKKKELDVYYLIDVSGSMSGDKIKTVNRAMKEITPMLKDIAEGHVDTNVRVSVLTFGNGKAKWHTERVPAAQFHFEEITKVDGDTPLGNALNVLNMALDQKEYSSKNVAPLIVLLSDGQPNDSYMKNLEKLYTLPFGKKAIKTALAIGNDADVKKLEEFTRSKKHIVTSDNLSTIIEYIKWTTTTIERIAANGGNDDDIPQFYSPSAPGSVDRLSIANSVLDDDNNERI